MIFKYINKRIHSFITNKKFEKNEQKENGSNLNSKQYIVLLYIKNIFNLIKAKLNSKSFNAVY